MKKNVNGKVHVPWNKNLKGIHLSPTSEFKKGHTNNANPRWREAIKKAGERRRGLPSPLKGIRQSIVEIRPCAFCLVSMELIPSRADQRYCSRPCVALAKSKTLKFRGTKAQYRVLHRWVERKLGQPKICESCKLYIESNRYIHWANKSGLYLRELTDWIRLCSKCHAKYDKL